MIPDGAVERVRRWADQRVPEHVRDQIRLEVDVTDRTITILECRPPWRPDMGDDWTRLAVARLRYTKSRDEWSLYWRDRNSDFHEAALSLRSVRAQHGYGDAAAALIHLPTEPLVRSFCGLQRGLP